MLKTIKNSVAVGAIPTLTFLLRVLFRELERSVKGRDIRHIIILLSDKRTLEHIRAKNFNRDLNLITEKILDYYNRTPGVSLAFLV